MSTATNPIDTIIDECLKAQATAALEALAKLNEIEAGAADTEGDHIRADAVLVDLLRQLGHDAVADTFERIPKWYS